VEPGQAGQARRGEDQAAGEGAEAERPLVIERYEVGEGDHAGADEGVRPVLPAQGGNGPQRAGSLTERHGLLGLGFEGGVGVVGATPSRLPQAQRKEDSDEDGDDEDDERHLPSPQGGDGTGDGGADDDGPLRRGAVDGVDDAARLRRVVVGEQRRVHGLVDQPAQAVADAHDEQQCNGADDAGEEREHAGQHAAGDDEARALGAVAQPADGHGQQQHDRHVEDDDEPEAGVGQMEALLDVGGEHTEGGGVELVEEKEEEEDGERKQRGAADKRINTGAQAGDHRYEGTGSKCSWLATSTTGTASPHTRQRTASAMLGAGIGPGSTGLSAGASASSSDTSVSVCTSATRLGTTMPRRSAIQRSSASRMP